MSTIETDFGEAGANLGDSHGGIPTVADALRDVADDFVSLNASANRAATIAASDPTALAVTPPPTPADGAYVQAEATATADSIIELQATVAELVTLTTELKTALNAVSAPAILTIKG